MGNRELILSEFQNVPENTLIMISELYNEKFSNQMSEAAFMQAISRLAKNGKIERVSKGIYCIPQKTRFGTVLPSDHEIADLFISHGNGVLIGYGLYNSLGITTQVSKRILAYSSGIENQLKQIGNVTIQRCDLEYDDNTTAIIQMMELFYHYSEIQDLDHSAFLKCIENLAEKYDEEKFKEIQKNINYPKRAIAFLRQVLSYYNIPNNLGRYLSALSNYRIPKMEELYAAAQTSR